METGFIPAWLIPHAKIALASLAGGMVRLFIRPVKHESWAVALFKSLWLLSGCVTCGFFGTPVALAILNLDQFWAGAVGALIGLVGMSIAEGILKAIDKFDMKSLILRLLNVRA